MDKIKKFFWLCSGSHIATLEKAPSESTKYVGIGATIFFTGLFAAIAAGYAIYTFTDNIWISTVIGVVWGAMIFNLDRYIVSSMRKSSSWKKEWAMATPRIVLALIISLVIARPLELKIFEKEILTELDIMNKEQLRASQDSINYYYRQQIRIEETTIAGYQLPLISLEAKRDSLRAEATAEADGTGGTMRRNAGPIYKIKKANADQADQEFAKMRDYNNLLIDQSRKKQMALREEQEKQLAFLALPDYTGFAARLEALGRLTSKSGSIWLANLFIIMLFIAIESAPVIVKLLSAKGPYDFILDDVEYSHELVWLEARARKHGKLRKSSKKFSAQEEEFIENYLSSKLQIKTDHRNNPIAG